MYRPSKYKRPVYKNTNPRRQRGENYVRYRLRLSMKRNLFLKIRTKNYSNLLQPNNRRKFEIFFENYFLNLFQKALLYIIILNSVKFNVK